MRMSASRTPTPLAAYFTYSDSNRRGVAPLVHHGSSRHRSPTTRTKAGWKAPEKPGGGCVTFVKEPC